MKLLELLRIIPDYTKICIRYPSDENLYVHEYTNKSKVEYRHLNKDVLSIEPARQIYTLFICLED